MLHYFFRRFAHLCLSCSVPDIYSTDLPWEACNISHKAGLVQPLFDGLIDIVGGTPMGPSFARQIWTSYTS